MKYKVLEDVSVSQPAGGDLKFKAGTVEVKEANREALERLEAIGLAVREGK